MTPENPADTQDTAAPVSANPGFALGQLAKAYATRQTHPDADTRARAGGKIANWIRVFQGMLSGTLRIGSRSPVARTPPWATLEVMHGGFATGNLRAGGILEPHERELLARLEIDARLDARAALNSYFLGEAGTAELQRMLTSGCYRINVPEEGALLTAAWLVAHDQFDAARTLLDAIGPFLAMLRFYPVPDARPLPGGTNVHVQTVRRTIERLQAIQPHKRFAQQREATTVWAPLYDRAVALFAETLDGPAPALQTGPDGKPLRTATGGFFIEGGWPCQRYPDDWPARGRALLEDYRRARTQHRLCGKPERAGENFTLLRGYLEKCCADPRRLTGRDVGMVRRILATVAQRRGLPGSPRCRQLRQFQADLAARPTKAELAPVVAERLAGYAPDDGVASLDDLLAPVSTDEAVRYRLRAGTPLAEPLGARVRRCLAAPVETLIELGLIPSGEVLAQVVPQLVGQVRAAGLADPDLRCLYRAIYQAFRRRRSLLLLNLESQVKLHELPWVQAIDAQRTSDQSDQTAARAARAALQRVVGLAVTAFPQVILPNKLLQEIRALAEGARLALPIVDEVAADIFMGTFSEKYLRAAQKAAALLTGTLYERYYDIPYERVRRIDDVKPSTYGAPTSPAFIQLCMERAGATDAGWSVARNGTIIEQEQILTTHNLAVLFDGLGLARSLGPALPDLARRCFAWICRRQQQHFAPWKARLQMIKNTAYAWRQMIFFLALVPDAEVTAFLDWAAAHLAEQRAEFQARFQPALDGLARAAQGLPPAQEVRFLGWTTGRHWLLA